MKVFVIAILTVLLACSSLYAQHINVGLKAGLNVYNIYNNNDISYEGLTGFHAGFLSHIHFTKQFALQPEVMYSKQGASFNTGNIKTNVNLDYIQVPVLLQYMFDNGFRIQAGPYAGFLIDAKTETNNIKTDIKNSFKKTELGLSAGISYLYPKTGLGADARYNFGLTDINENSSVKSMNRGLQVGVFYLFNN